MDPIPILEQQQAALEGGQIATTDPVNFCVTSEPCVVCAFHIQKKQNIRKT